MYGHQKLASGLYYKHYFSLTVITPYSAVCRHIAQLTPRERGGSHLKAVTFPARVTIASLSCHLRIDHIRGPRYQILYFAPIKNRPSRFSYPNRASGIPKACIPKCAASNDMLHVLLLVMRSVANLSSGQVLVAIAYPLP